MSDNNYPPVVRAYRVVWRDRHGILHGTAPRVFPGRGERRAGLGQLAAAGSCRRGNADHGRRSCGRYCRVRLQPRSNVTGQGCAWPPAAAVAGGFFGSFRRAEICRRLVFPWRPLSSRVASVPHERRHAADAARSFSDHGDSDHSNEWAGQGPLTIRTMREHGFLSSPNRPNAGLTARGVSSEAVPATPRKGRRPGAVLSWPLAGPGRSGSGSSLRFFGERQWPAGNANHWARNSPNTWRP